MLLTLTFTEGTVLLALVIASSLLAGLVVIWGRKHTPNQQQSSDQATPIIRSWIAISLVIGLLIFCAAAFMVSDTNLRSILLGGLVASVGSAVAFYFSSKSTDQAVSAVVALSQAGTPTNSCPVPLVGTGCGSALFVSVQCERPAIGDLPIRPWDYESATTARPNT